MAVEIKKPAAIFLSPLFYLPEKIILAVILGEDKKTLTIFSSLTKIL